MPVDGGSGSKEKRFLLNAVKDVFDFYFLIPTPITFSETTNM